MNSVRMELFELCQNVDMASFLEIVKGLRKKTAALRRDTRWIEDKNKELEQMIKGGIEDLFDEWEQDKFKSLDVHVGKILKQVQSKIDLPKRRLAPEVKAKKLENQKKILGEKVSSHFPNVLEAKKKKKKAAKKVAKKKAAKKKEAYSTSSLYDLVEYKVAKKKAAKKNAARSKKKKK